MGGREEPWVLEAGGSIRFQQVRDKVRCVCWKLVLAALWVLRWMGGWASCGQQGWGSGWGLHQAGPGP